MTKHNIILPLVAAANNMRNITRVIVIAGSNFIV